MRWVWGSVLLIGLTACRGVPPIEGTIHRVDVVGVVTPDGNLDVRETIAIAPDAGGTMALYRELRSPYADGVTFVSAAVDGVALAAGSDGVDLRSDADGARFAWRASGRPASTLELRYRLEAAVAVREPRGRLEWPVLAAGQQLPVDEVTVTLRLPDDVRTYDGTGMAEAGWSVELVPGGVVARREHVAASDTATLLAVFDIDHQRVGQPRWEWDRDRQGQFFLALLSAGAFLLVVGAGVLVQMRVQYPPVGADASPDVVAAAAATRRMLGRNLRVSAIVALAFGAVSAALVHRYLRGLGPATQAIPAAIAVVAAMFAVASWRYGRARGGAPASASDERGRT